MKKLLNAHVIYIIVILGLIGSTGFFYNKSQDYKAKDPAILTKKIKEKLGALQKLPDETPSVATVEDKEKLKEQAFFKDANNGDRLVVFQAAKQAFLYRESENKIINSGPIAIQQNQAAAKVTVKIIGKQVDRDAVEKELIAKFGTNLAIEKADSKVAHTTTSIVDISGTQAVAGKQIADVLKNAKVEALPAGEDKPSDKVFLIVAGQQ
jgi:SHS2 domain-containing protein